MMRSLGVLLDSIFRLFGSRHELFLENLALRQQLAVLKRKHPRPRLAALDRLFWVLASKFWSGWKQSLIIVTPETVVGWHRAGFALYWRSISKVRRVLGRKRISKEVTDLIFRMASENPTWGAPRIHGELILLGFDISERTVSRWIRRLSRSPKPTITRFLIFDRDAKYGWEVPIAARSMAIRPIRTSFESPWQNGVAERWVESCRRDLLDHVIALNELHLKRLIFDYVHYYHEDRTHLGLNKDTPTGRQRSVGLGRVLAQPRLGGLHHRYDRAA